MIKKSIQKMAFVNPYGKNVKEVKRFIYKVVDELLNRVSNAEKFPPLPKNIFTSFSSVYNSVTFLIKSHAVSSSSLKVYR